VRRLSKIFQIASLCLSPLGNQGAGPCIAARMTEHLVAGADEFRDNSRPDKTGGACDENVHINLSILSTSSIDEPASLR